MIVLAPPGSLDSRRSAPLGVRYFEQRDAARGLLVQLRDVLARFERCCKSMGSDPEFVAEATAPARAAIATAEAAGITEGGQ